MPRASTSTLVSMPCVGMPSTCGATVRVDAGEPTLNCSSPLTPIADSRLAAAAFVVASSGPCGGASLFADETAHATPVSAPSGLSTSIW